MSRSKNEILLAASAFILLAVEISAAFALRFSPGRAGSIIQYTSSHGDGIDINSADKEELTALDGIGEKKAENIIGYREEHGEFIYPWEITNVDGIGEKTYGKIKNDICAE